VGVSSYRKGFLCKAKSIGLCCIALILPFKAAADNNTISWSDVFSPERLSKTLLVYGISALRTVVDTTYGDITVDLSAGKIEISDLEFRPMLDWDDEGSCAIKVPRATISGQPLDDVSTYSSHFDLYNLTAPLSCLPLEARIPYLTTGKKTLDLPIISMGFDYDFPSGGLVAKLIVRSPAILGIELLADFSYVSFDSGAISGHNPEPVVYLRSASLVAENLGVWTSLKELMPPKFVNPDTGAAAVVEELGRQNPMLFNDGSADQTIESFGKAWTRFLSRPDLLVVETGFDRQKPIFFGNLHNIQSFIGDLALRFGVIHSRSKNRIPSDLIKLILADDSNVKAEDRARVGLAMLTGDGIPKNIGLGLKIIESLPARLAEKYAATIARSLLDSDKLGSYRWALMAGALNQKGAMSLMLSLEQQLSLDTVLNLQREGMSERSYSLSRKTTVAEIRNNARGSFLGLGRKKDYYGAIYWSSICSAAGDLECSNLEKQINLKLQSNSGWATNTMIQRARDAATSDWLRFGLDSTL
jgi:hypothetical protein